MTYFNEDGPSEAKSSVPSNIYAALGLLFGLISVFTFDELVPQILAISLASYGLRIARQRKALGEKRSGRGIAIAGLVFGYVYLFMWFLYLMLGRL